MDREDLGGEGGEGGEGGREAGVPLGLQNCLKIIIIQGMGRGSPGSPSLLIVAEVKYKGIKEPWPMS